MPYYSQSEIARIVGKSNAYISTYTKRGKLVKSGTVYDTDIPENRDFLLGFGIDPSKPIVIPPKVSKTKPTSKKETKTVSKKDSDPKIEKPKRKTLRSAPVIEAPKNQDQDSKYQADLVKKNADIEYKEAQTEKIRLEIARLRGENIPIDLVTNLVRELSSSLIKSYKEGAENIVTEMAHRTKMDPEMEAQMRGKLVSVINEAHNRAIDVAKKKVVSIAYDIISGNDSDE